MLKMHLLICNAVVLSGCVIGDSDSDADGSDTGTALLPSEGVWGAESQITQNTCAWSHELSTVTLGQVSDSGFKMDACWNEGCPDPERNVLLGGEECSLNDGEFDCDHQYGPDAWDDHGTTLIERQVWTGSFDTAGSGSFEVAVENDCEKSPIDLWDSEGDPIDDSCEFYWPETEFPCIWVMEGTLLFQD
jgi:hypothetical protein